MRYRASTYALVAVFVLLSTLAAVSWFAFPRNEEGRALDSWMLRPNAEIDGFSITVGDGKRDGVPSIKIEKRDGIWFALTNGKYEVPADSTRVNSFIAAMKRKRRIWRSTIANANSSLAPSAITLSLFGSDQTIASEIAFIGFDASAARIRFRSARDIAILETEDDLSPYLSPESGSWIDHAPFKGLEAEAAVQRAIVEAGGKRKTLSRDGAQTLVEALTSLTCQDAAPTVTYENPANAMSLEFGDLSTLRLNIYPADNGLVIVDERTKSAWYVSAWGAQGILRALGQY